MSAIGTCYRESVRRPSGVVFFGSFYPLIERLATTSTGLVFLLARVAESTPMLLVIPDQSYIPQGLAGENISVLTRWRLDSPPSLIVALLRMFRVRRTVSCYFFNIYLTSFGRTRIANAFGLLVPSLLALLTRHRVVVYLHNLVESQDIKSLGYGESSVDILAASFLEQLLFRLTDVVVPLPSQLDIVIRKFGTRGKSLFIPYLEAVRSSRQAQASESRTGHSDSSKINVLLFGAWGPQKDLRGALTSLSECLQRGMDLHITLAGSINANFPEYRELVGQWIKLLPPERVSIDLDIPEEALPALFKSSTLILLPYSATGGYSAVLNVAAFYGLPAICYDLPQLRETDALLESGARFIRPDTAEDLYEALAQASGRVRPSPDPDTLLKRLGRSEVAARELLHILEGSRAPDSIAVPARALPADGVQESQR